MGKDSPSPPPAPDYTGAATATAAGNLEAVRAQTAANRVNQITPYGNLTYAQTGQDSYGNPTWTGTQTLSPDQQNILSQNTNLTKGLLNTAQGGLSSVNALLANPTIDESKLSRFPVNPGETYTDAVNRYMQPTWDRQQSMRDTQLANQGIPIGSEAYTAAQRDLHDQQTRDQLEAVMQGMDKNLIARQQGIQEQTYMQDRPLNVVNALRTGNQVTGPQFVQPSQRPYIPGPDYLGAAQAGYNANLGAYNAGVGAQNSMMSGLYGLGAAALMSPTGTFSGLGGLFAMSDRRLKSNIRRIGTHPLGIGIYEYDIFGMHDTGVMADEVEHVMPAAVAVHPSGYKMVNYAMLGN